MTFKDLSRWVQNWSHPDTELQLPLRISIEKEGKRIEWQLSTSEVALVTKEDGSKFLLIEPKQP